MVFSWDMDGYFAGDNQLDDETLDAELSPIGGWSFPLPFCGAHTTEDRADHGIQYIYIHTYIIIYCIYIIYITIDMSWSHDYCTFELAISHIGLAVGRSLEI